MRISSAVVRKEEGRETIKPAGRNPHEGANVTKQMERQKTEEEEAKTMGGEEELVDE